MATAFLSAAGASSQVSVPRAGTAVSSCTLPSIMGTFSESGGASGVKGSRESTTLSTTGNQSELGDGRGLNLLPRHGLQIREIGLRNTELAEHDFGPLRCNFNRCAFHLLPAHGHHAVKQVVSCGHCHQRGAFGSSSRLPKN